MKFLIAVDLEGCACVNGEPYKSLNNAKDYAFACRQATREAAAGEAEKMGFERTDAYTCHKTFDKLSDYFKN